LLHSKTFYDCMINTILLGGDTDTNACIAGALYGACFGLDGIHKDWLNTVYKSYDERYKVYEPSDNNHVLGLLKKKLGISSGIKISKDDLINYMREQKLI